MGGWSNGEYVLVLFNLGGEQEPGLYPVLDLQGTSLLGVAMATKEGCPVRGEEGFLSVGGLDEPLYTVYPVPASDELTVDGTNIRSVEVFDLLGQRVLSIDNLNSDRTEINVSALAPGSYFVRINGIVTKKIVVR